VPEGVDEGVEAGERVQLELRRRLLQHRQQGARRAHHHRRRSHVLLRRLRVPIRRPRVRDALLLLAVRRGLGAGCGLATLLGAEEDRGFADSILGEGGSGTRT